MFQGVKNDILMKQILKLGDVKFVELIFAINAFKSIQNAQKNKRFR